MLTNAQVSDPNGDCLLWGFYDCKGSRQQCFKAFVHRIISIFQCSMETRYGDTVWRHGMETQCVWLLLLSVHSNTISSLCLYRDKFTSHIYAVNDLNVMYRHCYLAGWLAMLYIECRPNPIFLILLCKFISPGF